MRPTDDLPVASSLPVVESELERSANEFLALLRSAQQSLPPDIAEMVRQRFWELFDDPAHTLPESSQPESRDG